MGTLATTLLVFLASRGYLALVAPVFAEEAGLPLPLPGEVALLYAGYLAATGQLNPLVAGLVATASATAGAAFLYLVTSRGGRALVERWRRFLRLDAARLDRAEQWVTRFGIPALAGSRLTPGLRIITTAASGMLPLSPRLVFPAVIGATLLWAYIWIALGMLVGDRWVQVGDLFQSAGHRGLLAALLIVASVLAIRWVRQQRPTATPHRPLPTRRLSEQR